ncbi:hypothetical protein Bca4012_069456 [Brassica carinata]
MYPSVVSSPNSEAKAAHSAYPCRVLPYHTLMVELDVTNVRQLEDFLINACMYAGIVRGKLDQLKRCFEVPFAAGSFFSPFGSQDLYLKGLVQDVRKPDNNDNPPVQFYIEHIRKSSLFNLRQVKMGGQMDKKHRKEAEEGVEEVKRSLSMKGDVDSKGHKEMFGEPSGVMDCEEDGIRPKRRRHPIRR